MLDVGASCGFVVPGFAPCTRRAFHAGPHALPPLPDAPVGSAGTTPALAHSWTSAWCAVTLGVFALGVFVGVVLAVVVLR